MGNGADSKLRRFYTVRMQNRQGLNFCILQIYHCGDLATPLIDSQTSWCVLYHPCTVPVYKLLCIQSKKLNT
jgi:hypothetical protein